MCNVPHSDYNKKNWNYKSEQQKQQQKQICSQENCLRLDDYLNVFALIQMNTAATTKTDVVALAVGVEILQYAIGDAYQIKLIRI